MQTRLIILYMTICAIELNHIRFCSAEEHTPVTLTLKKLVEVQRTVQLGELFLSKRDENIYRLYCNTSF